MNETKTIKVKEVVSYAGHSISSNGAINFSLKAMYSELVNTIKVTQMLNNDVKIKAKIPGNEPINLGTFRIKAINVDGDGESKLKFNSLNDFVEMDNLNQLSASDVNGQNFTVLFEAEVEVEE